MTFGQAIEALKTGRMVRRAGWNGKGMHVYLEDGYTTKVRGGAFKGAERKYAPCLVLFNAQGVHQPGWNASTADVLADDWEHAETREQER